TRSDRDWSSDVCSSDLDRGLDFLAGKAKDGVFNVRTIPQVGVTGLCVLPMIERPGGMREKDKPIVDGALAYLATSIGEDGGVNKIGRASCRERWWVEAG